jgi:hypothetical protein
MLRPRHPCVRKSKHGRSTFGSQQVGRYGDDLKHWLHAESEILNGAIQDQSERSSAREASSRPKPHSSPAHNEEVSKK